MQEYPILYADNAGESGTEFGGGFAERWGWYQSFVRLAREHRCRVSEVGKEPLFESLTLLSFLVDEDKEQARQLKKSMRNEPIL